MTDLFNLSDADLIYQNEVIALCHEGFVIELYATKREIAEFLGLEVYSVDQYSWRSGILELIEFFECDGEEMELSAWEPNESDLFEYLKANKKDCVMKMDANQYETITVTEPIIETALRQGMKVEISPKKEPYKPFTTKEFFDTLGNILNPNK